LNDADAAAQDLEKLKRTLDEYFNVKLETKETSLKGWNWGKAVVQGESLDMQLLVPVSWC
jgi:structure-specific recognition protein 1